MQSSGSVFNTWWDLPTLVRFLQKSRSEKNILTRGINVAIILHAATIIEGFISQFIADQIIFIDRSNTTKGRLERDFMERIEKSSWNELQSLYKLMFGHDLSKEVDDEIWKGVCFLFRLRNLLVHSNKLEVVFQSENNGDEKTMKMSTKFEQIYNYLSTEKKIIKEISLDSDYPSIELITDNSADFFWKVMIDFLLGVINKRPKESEIVFSMFKRTFGIIE